MLGAPSGYAESFSVFLPADDTALAPLYDVATGFGQDDQWPALAMSIGRSTSIHEVTRRHLKKFAAQLGVGEEYVIASAGLLADGVQHGRPGGGRRQRRSCAADVDPGRRRRAQCVRPLRPDELIRATLAPALHR